VANINDVLDGHVSLELDCLDRIYLNAYVNKLQVQGQVAYFLRDHLGNPVPSPALFEQIGNRFRAAVRAFAKDNVIPVLRLNAPDRTRWDDRKIDHVQPHLDQAARRGRTGVVAIVAAQELAWVWSGKKCDPKPGQSRFAFVKTRRQCTAYYFYVLDADFGPGFIKIVSYFPYPAKVWVNGHEWVKRQADRAGLRVVTLANGFAACDQPRRLQAIADQLEPHHIQAFFDRWLRVIPTPLTAADCEAGFWWELSMRQIETSTTLVFDDPRRARAFFEALVSDNVGVGRPGEVAMVFARPLRRPTKHLYRQRIFGTGTEVRMDFTYKHSRVKQYRKEGRALRIETVINDPRDLDVARRLEHLPELQAKTRQVNRRLLIIERAGQGCAIETALFERISQPYAREGQRTGALRFGDPRVMALAGALSVMVHAVSGFTNKSLRSLVAGLLGTNYTTSQMTYDLRRLRLHGLIARVPRTNTYITTPHGLRVAIFYTKLHDRILGPLLSPDHPPAPLQLRRAMSTIDHILDDYLANARVGTAA
jgi:hypothetical protein